MWVTLVTGRAQWNKQQLWLHKPEGSALVQADEQPKVQKPETINLNGTVGPKPVKSQSQDALTWSQIGPFYVRVFFFCFFPSPEALLFRGVFKAFILSRQAIIRALHVLVYQHCQLSFKFPTFQTMSLQIQCEIGKWKCLLIIKIVLSQVRPSVC